MTTAYRRALKRAAENLFILGKPTYRTVEGEPVKAADVITILEHAERRERTAQLRDGRMVRLATETRDQ